MAAYSPRFSGLTCRQPAWLLTSLFARTPRLNAPIRLARTLSGVLLCLTLLMPPLPALAAGQIDIAGPPGSGQFGRTVTALPNGNIVVTDPGYDNGTLLDVGAAYLYDGATGALISKVTGSNPADQVGVQGVTVLSNGNYIVRSPLWHNSTGAVTWASATTGVNGIVSASNSLVGGTLGDLLGDAGLVTLHNGNYLLLTPHWHNGAVADVGAVTWGNGATGSTGVVNSNNSLVGSHTGDLGVGGGSITELSNGNYVVSSPRWSNGAAANAGAVTWGSGMTGISGVVSSTNSLVGSLTGDMVGSGDVIELSNGNYVVNNFFWHHTGEDESTALGAVTWGNGMTGVSGVVSSTNSLVGSLTGDRVGGWGVRVLSNGNYVVISFFWHHTGEDESSALGAVTWGNGMMGVSGVVSSANSLVGNTTGDQVGSGNVKVLSNGNYVVISPDWSDGIASRAGAVTWGNGMTGVSGVVSSTNSLVGSTIDDRLGSGGVTTLSNGNYVVQSPYWDNGAVVDGGAATWANGTTGISGGVTAGNSLIGSTANDAVGGSSYQINSVTALSNGNYVVSSPAWSSSTGVHVGAVTWGNGTTGISGVVTASNSLVGSTAGDMVGYLGIMVLSNGNYVVSSPNWHRDRWNELTALGAVTWGNGATGISGVVTASNSLVGSTAGDTVGYLGVTVLSNGNYVVSSPYWRHDGENQRSALGAVTWGNGTTGISGVVTADNSLVGNTAGDMVGYLGVTALSNGNYVVSSPYWHHDRENPSSALGAVTWGNGVTGISGVAAANNSLVGSTAGDLVGWSGILGFGVIALSNGNYVVSSPMWSSSTGVGVGAVTWGNGATGVSGVITTNNSLVGSTGGDRVGAPEELSNGNYVVNSPLWDNRLAVDAGAITWASGATGVSGLINTNNSVLGVVANGGYRLTFAYATVHQQLVVGRPADNTVTLFRFLPNTNFSQGFLPVVKK